MIGIGSNGGLVAIVATICTVKVGSVAGLGPGGNTPTISIESNGDLVTIAAQIPAVEVESASGRGAGGIGGHLTAARTAAGGRQDAIAARMDANRERGMDAPSTYCRSLVL
jgi:hypothetical protein